MPLNLHLAVWKVMLKKLVEFVNFGTLLVCLSSQHLQELHLLRTMVESKRLNMTPPKQVQICQHKIQSLYSETVLITHLEHYIFARLHVEVLHLH